MAKSDDLPCSTEMHQKVSSTAAGRQRPGKAQSRSGISILGSVAGCLMGGVALSLACLWLQTSDAPRSDKNTAAGSKEKMPAAIEQVPLQAESTLLKELQYEVAIRRPKGPPRADVGLRNMQGEKLDVACSTCHTARTPNRKNRTTDDLDEFHKGLSFSHGNLTCLACHNSQNYDKLQLADSTELEFEDVMTLCSQCHGTQRRDYDHGAHGGMTGYWDLSRGPRVRNNCVDCHPPHQPRFPKMKPTFKPRDRFLEPHTGQRHE